MDIKLTICTAIATLFCILLTVSAESNNSCCTGENVIVEKKCKNGHKVTALSCANKYLMHETEYEIDEQNNLLLFDTAILPDRYCKSQINNTNIVLVCFPEEDESSYRDFEFTLFASFELISVFFILLTIMVYLQVTDVLDLEGKCIMHSISGLAVSFFVLSLNQLNTSRIPSHFCEYIAYTIYCSMLYAFFWLNLLAFHIWKTVIKPKFTTRIKHWLLIYYCIGIGGPVLCLITLIIAHNSDFTKSNLHPGLGEVKCWFKSIEAEFVYFYGPIAVLLTINLVYYTWTIVVLWKRVRESSNVKNNKVIKFRIVLCVKLFVIMGITWIFEVISAAFQNYSSTHNFWIVTDCINTLQGVAIFLILVVFRKRVIRGLASRSFCGRRLPNNWKTLKDDECEDIEEEYNLSIVQIQKV